MTAGNGVYLEIAKKLQAPTVDRFINILEADFSPDEGEVILELFVPSTCREVAIRMNIDEKKVLPVLEELTGRGVINKGETQYAFHSSVIAYHHHTVGGVGIEPTPEKIKKAWGDFFYHEWSDMIVEGYVERQKATGRPVFRVWPAVGALELSPDISPDQNLPEENFKLRLQNTKRIIVGHCGCRKNWAAPECRHPIETCFAPTDGPETYKLLGQPGRTAIRQVSLEEALEVVQHNEQAGLVHAGACFCCTCSCEILFSLKKAGNRWDLLGRSRYESAVDEIKCTGCQTCVERCPFDAIEMKKTAASKKLKASIVKDKCMGCGVCIVGCQQKAMTYELVRPPESIRMPKPRPGAVIGIPCICMNLK
jgi:Pyruvate/2-oxoacid:ferredoxin oxidoreductase delta subunit